MARNASRGSWMPRHLPQSPRRTVLIAGLLVIQVSAFMTAARSQTPALRRVGGIVVDRSGAAVPRVAVDVRRESGETAASTITDTLGRFAFDLPDGTYTLDAAAPGLAPLRRLSLVVGPETRPLRLTLEIPAIEERIVVTATRSESPLAQVGSSTTVIRGEDLAREGIDSLADALRREAGLALVQNGGAGQLASLFLRGGESDYTKVLIDGIPMNDPGGSFNFANLSTSGIDRIEIVRGPQSALFGSDAMSGVIQIFTRRGKSEGLSPLPRVAVAAGSFATYSYRAGMEGQGGRLDYSASFARFDTDNRVENGSFNNTTVTGNLGFRPSGRSELRLVFRNEAGRAGVPGQWAFYRPDPDEYYRHRDLAAGAAYTHFTTPSWTQTLSYGIGDERQYSADSADSGSFIPSYQGATAPYPSFDFVYQTLNRSRRQNLGYKTDLLLPFSHLLTAGFEVERESGTVGDPEADPVVAVRNNYGGFVQDQWSWRRHLFAAAGVRLEHNDSFGFSASPRLSLTWHLRQPGQGEALGLTRFKANFGTGIKEPTFVESFSKSPFFLGNPDLKPERSASFDIGLEQEFGNGKGVAEVMFFYNRFRDQIGFVTTDPVTFSGTFFNIGKSRARGIEMRLRRDLGHRIEMAGSYTFVDSLVLENAGAPDPIFAAGQPLFRRPRHSGSLDIHWNSGRWTLGAVGTVVGSRLDSDFLGLGITRNPAYGTLDLFAGFRLGAGLSLFAGADNVLDRNYMEVLGYPALPARFRIGLRTGF